MYKNVHNYLYLYIFTYNCMRLSNALFEKDFFITPNLKYCTTLTP